MCEIERERAGGSDPILVALLRITGPTQGPATYRFHKPLQNLESPRFGARVEAAKEADAAALNLTDKGLGLSVPEVGAKVSVQCLAAGLGPTQSGRLVSGFRPMGLEGGFFWLSSRIHNPPVVISRCLPYPVLGGLYSIFFLTTEKSGECRPILNLKPLNYCKWSWHLSMEMLAAMDKVPQKGWWSATLDLKDVYLHIPYKCPRRNGSGSSHLTYQRHQEPSHGWSR